MTVTKSHHFNASVAQVVAAVLVLAFGVTESRANSIRYDDPNNGGVGNWSTASADSSGFKPAGVTGGPSIYEDTSSSDLYGFLPSNPLFSGYTTGFMFDWGGPGNTVTAQVMVYTGTDDGTQTVCDDQGVTCKTPTGTVTEIDFNYAGGIFPAGGCAKGGSLTWDGATYVDNNTSTSCDNAFMFVNGALFGTAPTGWAVGTTTPPTSAPEPATFALFGAGMGALMFTRRRRRF